MLKGRAVLVEENEHDHSEDDKDAESDDATLVAALHPLFALFRGEACEE